MSYNSESGHSYGNRNRHKSRGRGYGRNSNSHKWSREVTLRRGALTDYGWHVKADEETRHRALLDSIEAEGWSSTRLKLQVLTNLSNDPEVDRIVKSDLLWMDTEAKLE